MGIMDFINKAPFTNEISQLTQKIATSNEDYLFRNRGIAYLKLGKFEDALNDFKMADSRRKEEQPKIHSDDAAKLIAVTYWLLDKFSKAGETLAEVVELFLKNKITHSDIGGGIISPSLLWAISSMEECKKYRPLAEKVLLSKIKKKQYLLWPISIAHFLLGKLGKEEFMKAAERDRNIDAPLDGILAIENDNFCQAWFYSGWKAKDSGNDKLFDEFMKKASEYGETNIKNNKSVAVEFFIAKKLSK